ncbi:cation diffusion facilitator family transporter [Ancylomarina longa]|uniref:Cation transporter n=1 Tax=Ancylomarina longa TaxID=2487017 RepID=A0A434AGU7_9BACT|nr:cation diffusion facilitator family transporter [Ancylomarina longa]RUT73616.1 cation transporter [Ancylomarina longa]
MNKQNHHHHEVSGKNLLWSILLNVFITLAELIGGIISGSISLLSDAIHNFSDVLSLIISYLANKLTKKAATNNHTYGFSRSEVMAAFINATTLIVLAFYILFKGIIRLFNPESVAVDWVIWMALASIIVNGLSVLFISKDAHDNINIKSAYLHLFSDMLTSIAVLVGGLSMKYFGWQSVDAILSISIALYLLYSSWGIFKSAITIIMQFTPANIEIHEITELLSKIPEIKNIHHVHVWQINEHNIMFESHIDVHKDFKITDFELVLTKIKDILSQFNIKHVTIQPEFSVVDNKQIIYKHF